MDGIISLRARMAIWVHGCMIVEMYECMYGKCVPILKLGLVGLVTDGVWVCMSVSMALNERIEVKITDTNATTTITDQN